LESSHSNHIINSHNAPIIPQPVKLTEPLSTQTNERQCQTKYGAQSSRCLHSRRITGLCKALTGGFHFEIGVADLTVGAVILVQVPAASPRDSGELRRIQDGLDHFPAEHLIVVALFAFVQERTVRVVDGDVGALGVDEGVALEAADAQSWTDQTEDRN
jgi:hypothetical protein